ncbi:MAG TPA: hypothetical protein VF847_05795 [Candidatus Deferrimicrobiaceae bacterium]
MRLLIDGNEVPWDVSALRTFGEVLEEAGRVAATQGRVVSGVSVEGLEIPTRLERVLAERPPGEIGEVRISTTTPAALLREALDGALDLGGAILRDVRSVVASLKGRDIPAATSLYVSCVESLATFFQLAGAVFNGIQSGAFPLPEEAPSGARELPSPPSSTAEILERLLAAQKSEDWAAMAALLEDRIVPNLVEWSACLSAIRGPAPK